VRRALRVALVDISRGGKWTKQLVEHDNLATDSSGELNRDAGDIDAFERDRRQPIYHCDCLAQRLVLASKRRGHTGPLGWRAEISHRSRGGALETLR
jgi:hypothetical protein